MKRGPGDAITGARDREGTALAQGNKVVVVNVDSDFFGKRFTVTFIWHDRWNGWRLMLNGSLSVQAESVRVVES